MIKKNDRVDIIYEDETVTYYVMTQDGEPIYSNWALDSCKRFCRKFGLKYILAVNL